MGKYGKKQLDATNFFEDSNRIIVVGESEGYTVGLKERNHTPGCKVWLEVNGRPAASFNGEFYRLRDSSRPIARELVGLSPAEASAAIAARLPESVNRLVQDVWNQRDELYCAYCAAHSEYGLMPEKAVASGLRLDHLAAVAI